MSIDDSFHPFWPGAIKINAADFRDNVYRDRRPAHPKKLVAVDEILGCQSLERCAEFP